jgi:hypothetical protein
MTRSTATEYQRECQPSLHLAALGSRCLSDHATTTRDALLERVSPGDGRAVLDRFC